MIDAGPPRARLAILGTSLFAPEVLDLAEDTGQFIVDAFIENWDRTKAGTIFQGRPVVWIDEARAMASTHVAVCALGTTSRRGFIEQAAALGFRFATIRHPTSRVSGTSTVGDGCIISTGALVAAHAAIGAHVILNRGAMIGHHTTIRDGVTVCPGANIAGGVTIGEGAFIGIGAIVMDRVRIGEHAVVGAGSLVTKDVPARVQVTGAPARITKEEVDGR